MKEEPRKPNQSLKFVRMGVGGMGVCKSSTFSSSNPVLGNPKQCFHGIPKNSSDSTDALSNWAHSESHPHTEGTFARTLVNVGDLHRHSGECQEGSCEYGVEGSPNFARLRQSSHEGARMLLVHHRTCLIKGKVYPGKKTSAPQVLKHGGAKLLGERMRCPPPPQRIERHKSTTDLFQFFCLSQIPPPPPPKKQALFPIF